MKLSTRWIVAILVASIISIVGGVFIGEGIERNRYEVAKSFATIKAQELLDSGKANEAIPLLHLAKAHERIQGSTDALLGKAYLATGQSCLAASFFRSYLDYVDRNGLGQLASAAKEANTQQAKEASIACASTGSK